MNKEDLFHFQIVTCSWWFSVCIKFPCLRTTRIGRRQSSSWSWISLHLARTVLHFWSIFYTNLRKQIREVYCSENVVNLCSWLANSFTFAYLTTIIQTPIRPCYNFLEYVLMQINRIWCKDSSKFAFILL